MCNVHHYVMCIVYSIRDGFKFIFLLLKIDADEDFFDYCVTQTTAMIMKGSFDVRLSNNNN